MNEAEAGADGEACAEGVFEGEDGGLMGGRDVQI